MGSLQPSDRLIGSPGKAEAGERRVERERRSDVELTKSEQGEEKEKKEERNGPEKVTKCRRYNIFVLNCFYGF